MTEPIMIDSAPAERSSPEELQREQSYFRDERFFGELMHYVRDLVMIVNRNNQIVYANRAVLDMAGARNLAAVVGMRPGEVIGCKHARKAANGCGSTRFCRYCGTKGALAQSQSGQTAVEECRLMVERPHGEEALDLRVQANPIRFNSEKFTFLTLADIADEKRKHFLERIFLHDILNTATALRGLSGLLKAGVVEPEMQGDFIDRIAFLSSRIIGEIEAHQQLVAAENGRLQVDLKEVQSGALLQEIAGSYGAPDSMGGRILRIADDTAGVEFVSDPVLLRRVIGNMTKNAIEAALPGQTVTIGCRLEEGQVCFWAHNPTYMPEEIRLQIFKRSFSTKGQGRGLGTYSMKYLTEKYLGGQISFTSTEEEGTTFCARYPARPASVAASEARAAAAGAAGD